MALSRFGNGKTRSPISSHHHTYSLTNREPVFLGKPGPWGELEYTRINIEPPDQFLSVEGDFDPTQWFFEDFSPDQLAGLFEECHLPPELAGELSDRTKWQVETNGISIYPGDELILHLTPEARARIYSALSHSERNEFQCWPYTFRSDGMEEWLGNADLSPRTVELVKRLAYRRGNSLCFSDIPQLFSQIPTAEEKQQVVKALSRNSTMLMKLRIRTNTDVGALARYWDTGGRAKDIIPLLNSLKAIPGGATIDIMHLLPPFARKRVNTYPQPDANTNKLAPNCFWTVMNFFNDPPDDRYLDDEPWQEDLQKNYDAVSEPSFGDLIFFLRPDNVPIHAAVYIADDVVFTKNGRNECQPWILMKMDDLLARYPKDYPLRILFFRRLPEHH